MRTIACGAGPQSDGLIKELKTLFPHTAIQPIYGLTKNDLACDDFSRRRLGRR
ncbi:hypothetical protein MJ565_13810 [Klebsiella pneumoniae]|nr:hypothetical protein MJ565_13810 [Klebsiella pneumoniae]